MDDVDRSYYVYIHRDNESGVPFYVGRGKGKRAYAKEGRSIAWHKKVNSLSKGYSVELIKNNLTEDESCLYEMDLIEEYGKIWDGTGTLVNLTDGGDDSLGVSLKVELPDSLVAQIQEDYDSREYKELNQNQEKEFIENLWQNMEVFQKEFRTLQDNDDSDEVDEMIDLDCIIGSCIDNIIHSAKQRLRKKISYKDFAYGVGEELEDMQADLEDFEMTEETYPFILLGNKILKSITPKIEELKLS